MGAYWRAQDVYNFYFSQLRIQIEMAFGLPVNKWGVLQKPLKLDISKASHVIHVIHVCMRLHNFCVDERMLDDSGYSVDNEIDNIIATTMTNPRTSSIVPRLTVPCQVKLITPLVILFDKCW
jgi:hypothetical protein